MNYVITAHRIGIATMSPAMAIHRACQAMLFLKKLLTH